jgi:hypothetical protein
LAAFYALIEGYECDLVDESCYVSIHFGIENSLLLHISYISMSPVRKLGKFGLKRSYTNHAAAFSVFFAADGCLICRN